MDYCELRQREDVIAALKQEALKGLGLGFSSVVGSGFGPQFKKYEPHIN